VVHDVCIQNLPVNFCLDRAGFAGADGPTHHGSYDIAYLRCLPNMIIAAPMNEEELRNLMYTASLPRTSSSFAIRYPRGNGVMPHWRTRMQKVEIGKGRKLRDGKDLALLSVGPVGNYVAQAADSLSRQGIEVAHYDLRFVKPLDADLLHEVFMEHRRVITVEDGCIQGGFGSAVLEFMADHRYQSEVVRLGIPDRVVEHGEQIELHQECGFDPEGIVNASIRILEPAPKH
jgi:1-deoxy-D-xylulose-5-phosphate synthase